MFNLLPIDFRRVEHVHAITTPTKYHVDKFKENLDKYLTHIADEPYTPGSPRSAETNSLIHQIPQFNANGGPSTLNINYNFGNNEMDDDNDNNNIRRSRWD